MQRKTKKAPQQNPTDVPQQIAGVAFLAHQLHGTVKEAVKQEVRHKEQLVNFQTKTPLSHLILRF